MKNLLFTLAHVAVGIFVLWAIWPALQGSNDGYMTKTAGVDVAQPLQAPEAPLSVVAEVVEPEATPEEIVEPVVTETEPVTPEPASQPEPKLTPDPVATPELISEPETNNNDTKDETTAALYSVVDGNKLDAESYAGFKLFRNWCARCHAKYGMGLDDGGLGANLLESVKTLSKEEFFATVENGKSGQIGSMPAWKANVKVMENFDQIYSYLNARSDGAIGNVKPKKQN